jgi:hypothetical protein
VCGEERAKFALSVMNSVCSRSGQRRSCLIHMGHRLPTSHRRLMSTSPWLGVERSLFMRSVETSATPEVCHFGPSRMIFRPLPLLICFRPPLPSILSADPCTAIREPISGRVLGKLCVACVREHHSVCRLALCVIEAERGSCTMHLLFLDKAGHYGSA